MGIDDYLVALDVQVDERPPPHGRWGDYHHGTRTIRLRPDLGPLQRAYALAHEVGHAFYGHTGCHPKHEREADVFAATILIRLSEWRSATAAHDQVEAVASELGVLPKVVRVYHENLLRQQQCEMAG